MPANPEPKDKKQLRRPKQLEWLEDSMEATSLILGQEVNITLPLCDHPDACYGVAVGQYFPPGLFLKEPNQLTGIPGQVGTFDFEWMAVVPGTKSMMEVPLSLRMPICILVSKSHLDLREKKPRGFYRERFHLSPQAIVKLLNILKGPSYHLIDDAELLALQSAIEDATTVSDQVSLSVSVSSIREKS